jgi:nucleotide-binding universal stress UspA family protein
MSHQILLAVALQHWDAFSPHAVAAREAAVALARGSGATLWVLSVYDYGPEDPGVPRELASQSGAEVMRQLEAARQRRAAHIRQLDAQMETKMQAFLAAIPIHQIPLTPLLKVGNPRQVIVATAEALGVDLLVIGAHSKRSFLDILLGGTATAVSRHAPCAVVLVQPGAKRPLMQATEGGTPSRPPDQGDRPEGVR